ncbi:hypothetical protein LSH36_540g01016 [Paralvinella palmiformis]|uniref:Guanylate cyclase n=1 Tax=Paralvinella palmiformis TaxID=53620 RepID=A0AAD9MYI7_9ANNE|nr:hypothetical protein LSH36_540g01016 [Paralvinella palmiformis]
MNDVVAFIGPGCTEALDPVARLASYWNKPIITGMGDSGRFMLKTNYLTLTRFAYCQCRLFKVFHSVFVQFNWSDITVIMDRDHEYSLILGETMDQGFRKFGYKPNIVKYYSKNNPEYEDILRDASRLSRIMIISAAGDDVRKFLIAAYNIGYPQTGEYVFFDVEIIYFPGDYYGDHSWYRGDDDDEKARKAFESLIRVGLYMPMADLYTEFERKVKIKAKRDYNFDYDARGEESWVHAKIRKNNFDYDARGEEVNFFVGAFYDIVVHYGEMINKTLDTLGMDGVLDGYHMARKLWNQTLHGVTGKIYLDNNGDRRTNFKIMDMNPETGKFEVVAFFWGNNPGYAPIPGKVIHWAGDRSTPPLNEPLCYFTGDNPDCEEPTPLQPSIISLIVILCVVIMASVIGFLGYRKYQENAILGDMSWIVSKDDVIKRNGQATSFSMISMNSSKSDPETGDQVFGKIAWYKHAPVSLRESHAKITTINKDLKIEVNKRLKLQHNNIVRLIGIVIDSSLTEILHEYCPKGSLQDILLNDNITLDADFKRSLIDDIVRQCPDKFTLMSSISSPVLSSDNVVGVRDTIVNCHLGMSRSILINLAWIIDPTLLNRGVVWALTQQLRFAIEDPEEDFTPSLLVTCLQSGDFEGMCYIHNSDVRYHGRLRSTNCVVGGRFVLKLTDFGLPTFYDDSGAYEDENVHYQKLLWRAPELLRSEKFNVYTTKGDVYSFAVVLQEITSRSIPFECERELLTPKEIVMKLKTSNPPFRPELNKDCEPEMEALMKQCWHEDPSSRPTFDNIKSRLVTIFKWVSVFFHLMVIGAERYQRIICDNCSEMNERVASTCSIALCHLSFDCDIHYTAYLIMASIAFSKFGMLQLGTKNMNLMDNLLMRMEQYANNLEHLVADRTAQLIQEQRKTEELLLQILPKSIADQLKLGRSVEPECYDCVTIYFSDIVGFTALSASSSPLDVVVMLNDLYTAFDSTIGKFDVYKVETIGDAYMVASGLPIRNGDAHASEIASMSLELLEAITKFKIRHRPNEKLKLRIGLHSGSCVAGVVGLKMPRYCLFGDTVNTASRMESNGLPLKIHMSGDVTKLLHKDGGFIIKAREEIEIKGKGKMQTFWLDGRKHEDLDSLQLDVISMPNVVTTPPSRG